MPNIFPILIGGCDRSGTTLLGSMLGAHRRCICTPESQFKTGFLQSDVSDTAAAWKIVENDYRFKLWNFSPDLSGLVLKEFSPAVLLTELVRQYAVTHHKDEADFWIDHTPDNLAWCRLLIGLFPDARFVHLIRDGRAVAASVMPLDWGPNTVFSAAHWWLEKLSHGLATETVLPADQVIRIRFEDLLADPSATLRKICVFTGIEFQEEMLTAQGFRTPDYTSAQHALVGRPPDPRRANAWETKLTNREMEIFESIAGTMLNLLGYPPRFGLKAEPATDRERIALLVQEARRYLGNRLRIRRRRGRI